MAVAIEKPCAMPNPLPKELNSDPKDTTTATATEAKASLFEAEATRETALPKNWAPTAAHIERAKDRGIDVIEQADNFKLHAETYGRRAVSWNAAFTTWLKKSTPTTTKPTAASPWSKDFHK